MVYNPAGSLFSLPSRIVITNFDSFSHITNINSKVSLGFCGVFWNQSFSWGSEGEIFSDLCSNFW